MAEIKFTTERMKDVHERVDEMINQLQTTINSANEKLNTIANNIQSDNIKSTLSSYVSTTDEKTKQTVEDLKALDEYLLGKIGSYSAIDESGTESMSEVQSLLDQLNI